MTAPVLQISVTSTPELCALTHPRIQSLQYFGQQLNPFAQQFKKPGGRGQLRLFAIGLLVRMIRAIVTSLPVKPGKFE